MDSTTPNWYLTDMIREIDTVVWRKANGVFRYAMARGFVPFTSSHVLVNEYPKSGGTWLAEMLADALQIPFPQHRLPMLRRSILHGHYLTRSEMVNPVILFRDGRDVVNSLYFHIVVGNEHSRESISRGVRSVLGIDDPSDIRTYLPRFIDYVSKNPVFPKFTWARFVETWHDRPDAVETSYEALKADAADEITRIAAERCGLSLAPEVAAQVVERHSMQAGKKGGNSFRRKGIVGDWRNNFTQEAVDIFKHHSGSALITLGYEADNSWGLEGAASSC